MSHTGTAGDSGHLGCHVVSLGERFWGFQRFGVPSSWRIKESWTLYALHHILEDLNPQREGSCVDFYPCLQFTLQKRISLQCLRLVALLDHTKSLNVRREILSFVKVISDNSLSNVYHLSEDGVVSVVAIPWHEWPGINSHNKFLSLQLCGAQPWGERFLNLHAIAIPVTNFIASV
jgi:hypothetical protein